MKPCFYVDYRIDLKGRPSSIEVAKASSGLLRTLHAVFEQMPGKFALALPEIENKFPMERISTFRVFAQTLEDLTALYSLAKKGGLIGVRFIALHPEAVPENFQGEWVRFNRYRIPTRAEPVRRSKRMLKADEEGTTWIDMLSSSNDQRFRFYISMNKVSAPESGCAPDANAYGLSTSDAPVPLPYIR